MSSKIKKMIGFILFFFFLIFFSLFALGNKYPVKINLFPFPFFFEIPLYILVLLLIFAGFLLGVTFSFLKKLFN